MDRFYSSLGNVMDTVAEQLYKRYLVQSKLTMENFPFLRGAGGWRDSDTLKSGETVEEVFKHGTLSIGFIGLTETLTALVGADHGAIAQVRRRGQERVAFLTYRCDEYSE